MAARRKLATAADVIDALGGNTPVAALTGRLDTAVSNWRSNNEIPARFYLLMIEKLHAIGKTADSSLWGMVREDA